MLFRRPCAHNKYYNSRRFRCITPNTIIVNKPSGHHFGSIYIIFVMDFAFLTFPGCMPNCHADEALDFSWHTCSTFSVVFANTHDGSLPVCPASTQPCECEIAQNSYKYNENLSERTRSLEHNQHTFNINKKHYNRLRLWCTLSNALRPVDV